MNRVRFATIGTSMIVKKFLQAADLCEDFALTAVYSRDERKGREFAGEKQGIRIYTSLAELAQDPEIDAVYIASPTSLHASQAILMMESGKHVLCEKPAASNWREWQMMMQAAKQADVVLLEAMRPLFSPGLKVVKEHLGKLGTVRSASISYCQYSSRYDKFKAGIIENAFKPELSNGALMDIGIYCVESLVALFGYPKRIQGQSYILKGSIDAVGSAVALYDEMLGMISYSKVSNSEQLCEIQGEDGCITYEGAGVPKNVRMKLRTGEETLLFEKPVEDDMRYELEAFIRMIRGIDERKAYQQITDWALQFTDELRKQGNIRFPADQA